jgi:hypothetical protein
MITTATPVKRVLSPKLNPAGYMSAGLAVYAAVVMIVNVVHGRGVVDPPVVVAGVSAVLALLTRQAVTPVADPRDGNGAPLQAVPPVLSIGPGFTIGVQPGSVPTGTEKQAGEAIVRLIEKYQAERSAGTSVPWTPPVPPAPPRFATGGVITPPADPPSAVKP